MSSRECGTEKEKQTMKEYSDQEPSSSKKRTKTIVHMTCCVTGF